MIPTDSNVDNVNINKICSLKNSAFVLVILRLNVVWVERKDYQRKGNFVIEGIHQNKSTQCGIV